MNKLLLFLFVVATLSTACEKNTFEPVQPVILNDTSQVSGSLIARVFEGSGSLVVDADVYLYSSYEDVLRNLPVLNVKTQSNGEANFGSVLLGNYYITAQKGFKRDTVSAQVLSQNMTVRVLTIR